MSSASVYAVLFAVVLYVSLWQTYDAETFPATRPVDKEACEKVAVGNQVYANGTKTRPQSCDVNCVYNDGTTKPAFVEEGTPCCDIGVAPTGRCKGEKCVMGISG